MERRYDLGRDILKLIAIGTMTIDHIGAILYPEQQVLRIIGRLAFPLFSYLLVLGVESESNVLHYLTRLFLFGLISQVPFYLALGYEPLTLNVFFTLAFGVLALAYPVTLIIPFLVSIFLYFDYGLYGILLIACTRLLHTNTKLGTLLYVGLGVLSFFTAGIQIFSLLSLPLILLHKTGYLKIERDVRGNVVYPLWKQYSFYVYYPLHLTALFFVHSSF